VVTKPIISMVPPDRVSAIGDHHLKYAKALDQRRTTGGGKWPCTVLPTLSRFERDLVLALHRQIDRSAENVQAATPLSALAAPPDHLLTPPERSIWRRAVVSAAVIDARTGFSLVAGMDPATPSELLELLVRARVPHIVLNENLAPENQASEILQYARTRPANPHSHRATLSQRLIAHHLRDALWLLPPEHSREVPNADPIFSDALRCKLMGLMETDYWMLLEEVSLQRMVKFPACKDRSVKEFLLRSSVDAVIVLSRGEDSAWPLLAVEFDGPRHEDVGKIFTDSLKNALLEDAGIPLLRISFREVEIRRWEKATSDERNGMSSYLEPMKRLVRMLAHEEAANWRFEIDDVNGGKAIFRVREQMAAALYGKSFDNLGFIEQEMLRLQEPLASLESEHAALGHDREMSLDEMSGFWTSAGVMKEMKVDATSIQGIEFVEEGRNTWSATATYIGKNGAQTPIVAPPVSVNFPNIDRNRIVQMVHRYLAEVIAISATEFG
jgi:hypothetical protein